MFPKPRDVFDREAEWEALARFAQGPAARARLGLVYGRRRQGKSWLLERLARRSRGWYWEAIEGTARQQLDAFAEVFRAWTELPARPSFADWAEAIESVWRAAPPLLVLDEVQYLVASDASLPSVLQARFGRPAGPRTILCGSALGPMRSLLGTGSPLRGRASLELVVRPFGYRAAASYWRVGRDWNVAVRLHALVGGTPAYLDFAGGRSPASSASFDSWVTDVLLDPAGALFREGRILTDEPTLVDRNLYHGILAAVASGSTRRGQIGATLGRPDNTLAHPLNTLVELALLERVDDPLRVRRSFFRLAEPLLRTYQRIIAPNEGTIERRGAKRVWGTLGSTVAAEIYGPHFEELAREWVANHASEATLGGVPRTVGPSLVGDRAAARELEIDVVATAGDRVLALGEAKWGEAGIGELAALEHKRALLGSRAVGARLLVFGRGGLSRELRARARSRVDLELVDLDRLYRGS